MTTNTKLVDALYASDAASALTNRAGRAIEALEAEVERLTTGLAESMALCKTSIELNKSLQAQLAAAQSQIPRDDISLALLERLSKTLTRLGYATPEGGMEHFNAVLPHQLYNLCRGIDGVLDKLAAPIPQQPAEPAQGVPEGYAPLTIDETEALTAMVYGAPWSRNYCEGLLDVLAMYDELRFTGKRPVDPAYPQPKETK